MKRDKTIYSGLNEPFFTFSIIHFQKRFTSSLSLPLWNIGYQKEENVGSPFGIFGSFL